MNRFSIGAYLCLCFVLSACTGRAFAPQTITIEAVTTAPRIASVRTTCPAGQAGLNGNCYPVQSMDVSSQTSTLATISVSSFAGPAPIYGVVGLSGHMSLDLDQSLIFTEALVEIGYADSCGANFSSDNYDDLYANLTNPRFLGARIIKTNEVGHAELPVDFTLPIPVKASGCFFVDFSADDWFRPGANRSANVTITNALTLNYIDAGADLNASSVSLDESLGPGGEVCLGFCAINFDSSDTPSRVAQIVTKVDRAAVLRGLVGSISNGPFAGDGRYTPSAVSGAWSTEDLVYLDPQCSASVPGFNGLLNQVPDLPNGSTTILDVKLSGNGPASIANQPIFRRVNQVIQPGDCIVHVFIADSDSVIDMESQVSAILDGTDASGVTVSALGTRRAIASAPAVVANVSTVTAPAASVAAPAVVAQAAAPIAVAAPLETATVYRFYSDGGRHLYALKPDAYNPAHIHLEGASFSVYTVAYPNTTGLFRCIEGDQRYLSVDSGCEGGTVLSQLGYVSTLPAGAGTTPLYRFDLDGDWLETTDANEGNSNGYNNATVLASVPM